MTASQSLWQEVSRNSYKRKLSRTGGDQVSGDRLRDTNKRISLGITITRFGPALWTVVCYWGTSLSSSHTSPNRGIQSVFGGLWALACHTRQQLGVQLRWVVGGCGVSVDESEAGFCLCAYMLITVWMCQWSAAGSARRVWSNHAHIREQRCPFLSRGGCDQADADVELPGVYSPTTLLTKCKEAGGITAPGHPTPLSPRRLTIPISKSCQHRALCLSLAFCCGVHLECLGMLLERLNLAGVSKRRCVQY